MNEKEIARGVRQAIGQLKAEIDAVAVAVLDRRSAQIHSCTGGEPDMFWSSLTGVPCLLVAWTTWYRELLSAGERCSTCGCGERHQLYGLVIDERWVLLIVVRALLLPDGDSFEPTKAGNYFDAVTLLRFLLSEEWATGPFGSRGPGSGGESGPAELGIPLGWHRSTEE
jgi:hypothetical protein